MSFDRVDLQYIPKEIGIEEFLKESSIDLAVLSTSEAMDKLLLHARVIKEWRDRIDAIKYLQDNAAKLAGNPVYISAEQDICRAVEVLGGSNGTINFKMFQEACDIVLEGYKQMALVAITGAL
jgi:hypothetical protein